MENVFDHFSEQRAMFSTPLADATSRGASAEVKGGVVYVSLKLLSLESHLIHTCIVCFTQEISLPSFVFDKGDLPFIHNSEVQQDTGTLLSLPEQVCDGESERDTESDDEHICPRMLMTAFYL